jgi:aspartate 1-decarboxylase
MLIVAIIVYVYHSQTRRGSIEIQQNLDLDDARGRRSKNSVYIIEANNTERVITYLNIRKTSHSHFCFVERKYRKHSKQNDGNLIP